MTHISNGEKERDNKGEIISTATVEGGFVKEFINEILGLADRGDDEEEIGQELLKMQNIATFPTISTRTIAGRTTKRRCKACRESNQSICNKSAGINCDYCRENNVICTFGMSSLLELDQPYYIQQKMRDVKSLIYPTEERRGGPYARLSEDTVVDSALLDALHRALSNHSQVLMDNGEGSLFNTLDPSFLLGFGILAEELIRSLINDHLNKFL